MVYHIPGRDLFIKGPQVHLPEDVVTNEILLQRLGLTTGMQTRRAWIEARTGIQERRWVKPDEACSDLATAAAKKLLNLYPESRSQISHLILSTISGDYLSPPTSPFVQHALGLSEIGTMDVGAACAGFLVGLHTAATFNEVHGREQLLIASDIRSKFLNPEDLGTAILFGDAAVACLVSREKKGAQLKYIASSIHTDGSVADIIKIPVGGSRQPFHLQRESKGTFISMGDGANLFFKAVEGMEFQCRKILEKLGLQVSDIAGLIPHQANILMIRELTKRMGFRPEQCTEIIQRTGNTSGASVGLALESALALGKKSGDKLLLVAAGGGGFLAASVLEVL